MIPVKLKLSNFTSYGENPPELDFTTFHLAAISGLNGAGKSSLLDAATWCIWGQSRAGDSSDALVRLGQSTMWVEFAFELDGHIYTIKRQRSKKGAGSTSLELWSGSTGPSILKSSGLKGSPQVHNLTEGTIKTTQQKIIDILHLTFETFTNSAFLRQGQADEFTTKGPTDRKRILADILGLDHYDALEEKAKEKAKAAQTKLQVNEYQLIEIEAELLQKDEREKSLSLAEAEANKVEKELKDLEELIKAIEEKHQSLNSHIKTLEEKRSQGKLVEKELQDLRLQIEVKERAQQEFQAILGQKVLIEANYAQIQKIQQEKEELEVKRSLLIKIKDQLAALQKTIMELEERRGKKMTSLEVEIKKLQTENEQLNRQIEHLKSHKDSCPTCGQAIGEEKNQEIVTANTKKVNLNTTKTETLEKNLHQCRVFELKEAKQAQEFENQIQRLEEATKNWNDLQIQLSSLDKYHNLYIKLQQAETGVKTHQEAITDLQKIYRAKEEQVSKLQEELKKLETYETQLKEVREQLQAQEVIKQGLAQKALDWRSKVGEARQLVSRSEQLANLYQKKQTEKSQYTKEKEIFEELALAFGKKGIQAMIIENAIPEIEDEANRLLERLTDGRMKVRLETQKETKTSQNLVETLDIVISDEMGERAYEMYSGGEAFRADIAIRLAISKLLTHRAGAKLQFLVIDEGFGNQDAPGRSRLVEVIDSIKDDYKKILVITHIEELKEEFPVRIEVIKNSGGSTFEVVGV